jgi:deoxyribose-phosphate aldolase
MRIDHTLLTARTSAADVDILISAVLADAAHSRGIVVPPVFARRAVEALRGSGVRVASVAGYPLGLSKSTLKAIEATGLAKDGVDAVELTPLPANIVGSKFDALRDELRESVRGVRAARQHTSLHARVDLDACPLTAAALPMLLNAIAEGACDGIVLEARTIEPILAVLSGQPDLRSLALKITLAHGEVPASLRPALSAFPERKQADHPQSVHWRDEYR